MYGYAAVIFLFVCKKKKGSEDALCFTRTIQARNRGSPIEGSIKTVDRRLKLSKTQDCIVGGALTDIIPVCLLRVYFCESCLIEATKLHVFHTTLR